MLHLPIFLLLVLAVTGAHLQNITFLDEQIATEAETDPGDEDISVPILPPTEAPPTSESVVRVDGPQSVEFSTLQRRINWLTNIKGTAKSSHIQFSAGSAPPGFSSNYKYFLGVGSPNWAYPTCTKQPNVKCRFLEHCAQSRFLTSFQTFSDNSCKIGNDFIGVCCGAAVRPPVVTPSPPPQNLKQSPPKISCGRHDKFVTKVEGGDPAEKDEWPWMVAILTDGEQKCGGSLISNQHVLTAAHCLNDVTPGQLTARLGEYDLSVRTLSEKDVAVSKFVKHEAYSRSQQLNDIALLKLSQPITFDKAVRHICLPEASSRAEGSSGYVTGWGTICFGCASSNVLLELYMPVWQRDKCVEAYKNHQYNIQNTQICAGFQSGKKDSCQGDSGGPLMIHRLNEDRWYVEGVVSFGRGCARPNSPGVYTRVASYVDWIKSTVRSL